MKYVLKLQEVQEKKKFEFVELVSIIFAHCVYYQVCKASHTWSNRNSSQGGWPCVSLLWKGKKEPLFATVIPVLHWKFKGMFSPNHPFSAVHMFIYNPV